MAAEKASHQAGFFSTWPFAELVGDMSSVRFQVYAWVCFKETLSLSRFYTYIFPYIHFVGVSWGLVIGLGFSFGQIACAVVARC